MQLTKQTLVAALLGSWLGACNPPPPDDGDMDGPEGTVQVVITALDGTNSLYALPTPLPMLSEPRGGATVTLGDPFGPGIRGFGAALTGSSAYLLHNQPEALQALYDVESGIGLSYLRLTVGASDFNAIDSYTYSDITTAEDLTLAQFSIAKDLGDRNPVVPVVQDILALAPEVTLMASPWTAPPWMKTSKSYIGGRLLPQYQGVYADYFVRYLKAYEAQGVTIDAITVQNEPLHSPASYPGMLMSAETQATFIGEHLGPALEAAGLDTRIVAYDHNYREEADPDYPLTVLGNAKARSYIDGVGYHAYGGNPSHIDPLLSQFPDTEVYFTEQSGIQSANTSFRGELVWFMQNVFVPLLQRGATTILLWNLALDENAGPQNGGCDVCRGVLTVTTNGAVVRNPEYYLLGHFSRYVRPGAQALQTRVTGTSLEPVAFINPDSSRVMVVLNPTDQAQSLTVQFDNEIFEYTLPAQVLVTLIWKPEA